MTNQSFRHRLHQIWHQYQQHQHKQRHQRSLTQPEEIESSGERLMVLLSNPSTTSSYNYVRFPFGQASRGQLLASLLTPSPEVVSSHSETFFKKLPDDLIMQLLSVEQRTSTLNGTNVLGESTGDSLNELDYVNPFTSNLLLFGIISLALVCLILLTVLGKYFSFPLFNISFISVFFRKFICNLCYSS